MSPMRLIILLVAAVSAIAAAIVVRNITSSPTVARPSATVQPTTVTEVIETPQTPVLVMLRDVRIGELLGPDDFEWRDWPDATLNPNYFTQDIAPTAIEDLAGSVVRTAMVEQEPVLPQKVVRKGETGYMAALLTPGLRAVSVEISADKASGGFILPGDRVDVMVTYDVELTDPVTEAVEMRPNTTTIMENVRILAIDQQFRSSESGQYAIGSTATVELEPEMARLLVMADRIGEVSLALRSLQDADDSGEAAWGRTDFLLDFTPYDEGRTLDGDSNDEGVTVYRNGSPSVELIGEG
ncbi:MAG: Flp pilus assembly protein CpaB [Pseudomonadota bacterium]